MSYDAIASAPQHVVLICVVIGGTLGCRYTLGVYGYIYVYSVASRRSFEMVKVTNEKLKNELGHDGFPRVIPKNT